MKSPLSPSYLRRQVADRISSVTRFYDRLLQWRPEPWDDGSLLDLCECSQKERVMEAASFPDLSEEEHARSAVLLNGSFNHHLDIQRLLLELWPRLSRSTRLVVVCYNPYLRWVYRLAYRLGVQDAPVPTTFVTHTVLHNLARISGYEIVRTRAGGHVPWSFLGLGSLLNRVLAAVPGLRNLGLATIVVLRANKPSRGTPSLSIVVPARNERDNIRAALDRLPDFGGCEIEVIFVEGHSTDGTWEEICRLIERPPEGMRCRAYRQQGSGKADAVRLGLARAKGELLTILDADLTMPPELLVRYYDAYREGRADFVNGSRLVYPMEDRAMRRLNQLGNLFFAKALSTVLDVSLSDVLCGTKLFARHDYLRFEKWRMHFGEIDPFGDFELLFPAASMALGIVDVPVRYRARSYGDTDIHRFSDGWKLLKMTWMGLWRIKMGGF